jgi:hypothetical protein
MKEILFLNEFVSLCRKYKMAPVLCPECESIHFAPANEEIIDRMAQDLLNSLGYGPAGKGHN